MTTPALTAESTVLLTIISERLGTLGTSNAGYHVRGVLDDVRASLPHIEAAAAREALEAVQEPVANAIRRALRAPSTIDETRYFDSLLAVDAAKLALGLDDSAQRGGEGS